MGEQVPPQRHPTRPRGPAARVLAALCALLLGAAAAALVACGGNGSVPDSQLIPEDQAARMIQNLDDVNQRIANDDCEGAAAATNTLQGQLNRLSDNVNLDLRETLREGVNRLVELVSRKCAGQTQTDTTTTETIPTTVTTETTTTQTTTTAPPPPTTPGGGGTPSP